MSSLTERAGADGRSLLPSCIGDRCIMTSECIAVQLARQDGMQNVHNTKLFRGDNDDIMAQF